MMNKFWIAAAATCLFAAGAVAQTPAAGSAAGPQSGLSNGTTLQAELTKSVDVKKAKAGDEITAKATQDVKADGKVVVNKGSKLVGHITETQAKGKDSESKLGVVFDKAVLKNGQEVAFNGVIVSFAAPVEAPPTVGGVERGTAGDGRTRVGPSPYSTTMGAPSAAPAEMGAPAGANGSAAPNPAAGGLVGMEGVAMNATAAGSVFHSSSKNIKLENGAQIVLQVATK